MDMSKVILDHMEGFLVISDIHGEYDKMMEAVEYAKSHYLHIVFLGDLVDGGDKPYETVKEVKSLLDSGMATFIMGNHDYKWHRAILGNKVIFTDYMITTVFDIPYGLEQDFMDTYQSVCEHKNTTVHATYMEWAFVHAAIVPNVYTDIDLTKKETHTLLYGSTNGRRDDRGFPVRLYDWIDDIPKGHKAIVGHDRAPMGKTFDGRPEMYGGALGGLVIFTDTGCGKREDGTLTATSLKFVYDIGLTFDRFISF